MLCACVVCVCGLGVCVCLSEKGGTLKGYEEEEVVGDRIVTADTCVFNTYSHHVAPGKILHVLISSCW